MGLDSLVQLLDMIGKYGVPLVLSAVMVFVLLYLLRVMLPARDREHAAAMVAKDTQYAEELKLARTDFRESLAAKDILHASELKLSRTDFRESLERILGHCMRETAFRDEVLKKEMAEVSAAVTDFRRTLEEFREELIEARTRKGKPT